MKIIKYFILIIIGFMITGCTFFKSDNMENISIITTIYPLEYALNYDMPYDVGTRYAYNNVEPFIISVLFEECFNINLSDFVRENIFEKLGIKEYQWGNYGYRIVLS